MEVLKIINRQIETILSQFWKWRFIFFFWKFKILKIISIFVNFKQLDDVVDRFMHMKFVRQRINYKRYQIKSICVKTIDSLFPLFCYSQLLTTDMYNYRTNYCQSVTFSYTLMDLVDISIAPSEYQGFQWNVLTFHQKSIL